MKNQALIPFSEGIPTFFGDLFNPWNSPFEDRLFKRAVQIPAVNITEHKDHYLLSLSAPGLKKADFKIDVNDDILTISSENEEQKETKDGEYTRQEYNYSSFSRSFVLPAGTDENKLSAKYEDGLLKINIPRNGNAKNPSVKQIAVN